MGKNSTDNLSYENTLEALREKLKDVKNFSQTELDEYSLRIFTSHLIAYCTNLEREADEVEVKAEKIFQDLNIQPAVIQIHDEHNKCEIKQIQTLQNGEIIYIPIFTYKDGEIIRTNLITVEKLDNSINVTNFINEKQYGEVEEVNAVGEVMKVLQENLADGSKIVEYENEEIDFKTDSSLGSYTIGTQIARLHLEKIRRKPKYLEFFSKAKVNFDTYSIGHLSYFYECAMGAMHSLIHKTKRRGVESGFDLSMPLTRGSVEGYEALVEEGQNMFEMYRTQYVTGITLRADTVHLLSLNMINFFIKNPNFDIADQSKKIDFSQSTPEELQKIFDQITMFDISEYPKRRDTKPLLIRRLQALFDASSDKVDLVEDDMILPEFKCKKSEIIAICGNLVESIQKREEKKGRKCKELLEQITDLKQKFNVKKGNDVFANFGVVHEFLKILSRSLDIDKEIIKGLDLKTLTQLNKTIAGLYQSNLDAKKKEPNQTFPFISTQRSAKLENMIKQLGKENGPNLPIFLPFSNGNHHILVAIVKPYDKYEVLYCNSMTNDLTGYYQATHVHQCMQNLLGKENVKDKITKYNTKSIQHANTCGLCVAVFITSIYQKYVLGYNGLFQYSNAHAKYMMNINPFLLGYNAFYYYNLMQKTLLEKIHDHLPNGEFLRLLYPRFGNPVWDLMKQGLGYYKPLQKLQSEVEVKPEPVLPEPKPKEPPIKQDSEQDKESEEVKYNTWQRFKEGVAEIISNSVFYNIVTVGIIIAVVVLVALIKSAIDIKGAEMNSTTALHTSVSHTKIPNYTGDKARYNISPAVLERVKNAGTKGLPGGGHSK